MKRVFLIGTLAAFAFTGAFAQEKAKEDLKTAGSETKDAAKHVGKAAKKGAVKTTEATKKGVNKSAGAVEKGAHKVKSKTKTTTSST